jgi:predicted permease
MNQLRQDLRYALRTAAKNPGITLVVIVVMGLAIGANTVIYTVVDAVLLTPLGYPQAESLVAIYGEAPTMGLSHLHLSPPEYTELRAMARSYSQMGAYMTTSLGLVSPDEPLQVSVAQTTASLFATLGARAQLGSLFTAASEVPGAEPVVVLSDALWRQAFSGDVHVLGKRLKVDGAERTVIGVAAPGLTLPGEHTQAWLPLTARPVTPRERTHHVVSVVGRLRPGATLAQARREMSALLARWPQELPSLHTPTLREHPLGIEPLLDSVVGKVRPTLRVLWAAVVLVLFVACANVSNLLLARAEVRQQEVAIRTALGAGAARLLRQFVTESVLLSLVAGLGGLLLSFWGLRVVVAASGESLPRLDEIRLDWKGMVLALALSLAIGLFFGLAPARHARQRSLLNALKEGGHRVGSGRAGSWLRRSLMIAELALASLLVITCGLLLRSFLSLQRLDLGFRAAGVLSAQVSLPRSTYREPPQVRAFYQQLLPALGSLPGVDAVAIMKGLPLQRYLDSNGIILESRRSDLEDGSWNVDYWQFTTPGYFQALDVKLVAGRLFLASDAARSAGVVLVNETMARSLWPGMNPLGQRLRAAFGENLPWLTVVGIVRDVAQKGLGARPGAELYFPLEQAPEAVGSAPRTASIVLHTTLPPGSLAGALRERVHRLDPALPVSEVQPLDAVVGKSIARPRFIMMLVLVFAGLALIVAVAGTYSVLAYTVEQRTREIGVRMALGADPERVLGGVLAQGASLLGLGLALGLLLSLGCRQVLGHLLFGIGPSDPASLVAGLLVVSLAALAAIYLPARRAAHIEPMIALRLE